MKTFILLIITFAFLNNTTAQKVGDILKQQAGEGVKQGAAVGTEHATDKVLSKLFSKKNKNNKPNQDNTTQTTASTTNNTNNSPADNNSSNASLQTYSKFDFVPGEKVLVYEDFSQDAVGDFPDKWNTNSAGEIVTINGQPGHWLMLNKKGLFMPEYINNLPDNFTLEFDVIYNENFGGANPPLQLLLLTGGTGKDALHYDVNKRSGVNIGIQPILRDKGGLAHIDSYEDGNNMMDNQTEFHNNGETKIKVSIWRQKQRMRVYLNQEKVFDLPRAFPEGKIYNMAMFELLSDLNDQDKYLIGNIKLAAGAPDTRNKLISEGKFSTTGILFDVSSANIKPESYGSLKDIADVLKDNANVRVKIIGHTDNDGNAATNLTLSKKRAEAVKSFLENEFKIDASRMETDGKGASEPAASNSTAAGKAQNRRVEFVKL